MLSLAHSSHKALHLACFKGHEAVVRVMVKHEKDRGVDLTIKNKSGQTALELAQARGHTTCFELLGGEVKKEEGDDGVFVQLGSAAMAAGAGIAVAGAAVMSALSAPFAE